MGNSLFPDLRIFRFSLPLKQVSFQLSQIKDGGKKSDFQWCTDEYYNNFTNQSTYKLGWIIFTYLIANKAQFNSCPAFCHVHCIQGHTFLFCLFLFLFFSFSLGHLQPPLSTEMQGYKCKGTIHHEISLGDMSSTKCTWISGTARIPETCWGSRCMLSRIKNVNTMWLPLHIRWAPKLKGYICANADGSPSTWF